MDITGENALGVGQDCLWIVGKDDFYFRAGFLDELFVVFHIINASEYMFFIAKEFSVFFFCENIRPWVYTFFIHDIQINEMVSYFIRRIA